MSGQPTSSTPSAEGALDDLTAVFQPVYNLGSRALQGVEALARRTTSDGAAETPADFFAAVRESGTMVEVDRWMLRESLTRLQGWLREPGLGDLWLALNLSWEFMGDPKFDVQVLRALERHRIPGHRLLIDTPADTFRRLRDADGGAFARLRKLQDREITFCLDGFTADDLDLIAEPAGIPLDIIKLHPQQTSGNSDGLSTIVDAIERAGLTLVAAGVETAEQLRVVEDLGCQWAQGFFLTAPVPADAFPATPRSIA